MWAHTQFFFKRIAPEWNYCVRLDFVLLAWLRKANTTENHTLFGMILNTIMLWKKEIVQGNGREAACGIFSTVKKASAEKCLKACTVQRAKVGRLFQLRREFERQQERIATENQRSRFLFPSSILPPPMRKGISTFRCPQRAIAQILQHKNALLIFLCCAFMMLPMSPLHPIAEVAESCFICSNLKTRFSSFSTFWLWKWFSIHYQGCGCWLKWVRFIHLLLRISHAAYLKYFCPV